MAMNRRLIGALVLVAAACTGGSAPDETAAPGQDTVAGAAAADLGAPSGTASLKAIMQGLQASMATLHLALWLEEFEAVAAAAREVADHPQVPAAERLRIQSVLEDDFAAFAAADRRVHDTSLRLRDAALQRDTAAVLSALADVHVGCVACHTRFRARLLGETTP
jgi:cytochrome c556